MKRLISLLFLAVGLTAAAQNSPKYEQFKTYRDEADTLRMKQMLDSWGEEDAEYYAAWTNYCWVMAEETMDEDWIPLGLNWIQMGRDQFPDNHLLILKQGEVLFNADCYQEALPVLLEADEKGIADVATWFYLASIYSLKNDRESARPYLDKMIQNGDDEDREYAQELLQYYDEVDHTIDSLLLRPDHEAIRKFAETADFQALVSRFEACDTTLTREEISTLYYGSAYVNDYNMVSMTCSGIRDIVDEGRIQEAVDSLQVLLKDYPVSMYILISIFNLSEDEAVYEPCAWKVRNLLTAIDFSGTGISPESPLQVICVNDEYSFLSQVYDMEELKSQELLDDLPLGPQDRMTFVNSYGLDQVAYFYLAPPYWERLNALTEE